MQKLLREGTTEAMNFDCRWKI